MSGVADATSVESQAGDGVLGRIACNVYPRASRSDAVFYRSCEEDHAAFGFSERSSRDVDGGVFVRGCGMSPDCEQLIRANSFE